MEAIYFDDLEPIDFLQNADNVYRTEEYIVKQKLSLSRDKKFGSLYHKHRHLFCTYEVQRQTLRRSLLKQSKRRWQKGKSKCLH